MTEVSATVRGDDGDPPVVLHARVVTGAGGGPDKTVLNSPRFLAPLGYRAVCAYMHPPGDPGLDALARRADEAGAALVSVPDRGPFDLGVVRRLADICRSEQVAIWHGHDYKSNALGLLLRRRWPMRLVTTVHGWVKRTRRTPLYYWIDRLALRRYERVICVSPDLYDACAGCGVPAERLRLVENAIDTSQFVRRRAPGEARRLLGLPVDRPLVGAVGRLSDEKGFDALIRAAARLLATDVPLTLVILGEGDRRPALQSLIGQLGRQDDIRLVGHQLDTLPWYEAMDIFALSSVREGLPNVVLEAMALAVPVVATRVAGVPRLVEDGTSGLLVEPGNVAGLAAALRRLLADPIERSRLAAAGRHTVETRYSFAVRMRKVAAVYDELLGRVGGGDSEFAAAGGASAPSMAAGAVTP